MYWLFRDYFDHRDKNVILGWLLERQHSGKVRARLDVLLDHLANTEHLEASGYVEGLKGDCGGLLAIMFTFASVEHRIMMKEGPKEGEVALLIGATKAGRNLYNPRDACERAKERYANAQQDSSRLRDHE